MPQMWNSTPVLIIGAGRAGRTLSSMLSTSGITVSGIVGRQSADERRAELGRVADSGTAFQLVFAVQDDLLPEVTQEFGKLRSDWSSALVWHCAGGVPRTVLSPFAERGAETAVLHPCYPISSPLASLPRGRIVAYTLEAGPTCLSYFEELVDSWEGVLITVSNLQRELYHAGNVLAAGHVVSLLLAAEHTLTRSGLRKESAHAVIRSLIAGSTANLERVVDGGESLGSILTGPFVRDDIKVIRRQHGALQQLLPELGELYTLLGKLGVSLKMQERS